MNNIRTKFNIWDLFIFINLISLFGGITYRLYRLNYPGIVISVVLSVVSFFFLYKLKPGAKENIAKKSLQSLISFFKKEQKVNFLTIPAYYTLLAYSLYVLVQSRTMDSIISPWEVIPNKFFYLYFLSSLVLLPSFKRLSKNISLLLISSHFFLSFIIAITVYKIGYGFDPFIHEATMDVIKEKGFINPKPLYYLGFYSIIIISNKLLFIPIAFLNKFLVPLLASVFIPRAMFDFLKSKFDDIQTNFHLILFLLIIPFSFLIMSTPQNLAYLLLFIIIIKSLHIKNWHDLISLYLFSLVAIITQPIAGIPALFLVLIMHLAHSELKYKKIAITMLLIINTLVLPSLFYIFESSPESQVILNFNITEAVKSSLSNTANLSLTPYIPVKENIILNSVYLFIFNIKMLFLLLALFGFFIYLKNKKACKYFIHFLLIFTSLYFSYILASSLSFSFLVEYERSDYANRVLLVSAFFLLPFIILSLYSFLYKLKNKTLSVKLPIYSALLLLMLASLYSSYPRFDSFKNSHGISTGQYDIEATEWIEKNKKRQFFVLANQQVSVAALKNYGFNKYFSNNIYYYPIPTSSPLYQIYLDMVYDKPSKENMLKGMNLLNINEGYFILNKYWWAFPKILEEAKLEADSFVSFGDSDVFVFKYTR